MELLLSGLKWAFKLAGVQSVADLLSGWTGFLGFFLSLLLIFLTLRWFRNHVMWSVRNRLIVTYLFIGALPITLAVAMAAGSLYRAVERLATFLAMSEIRAQGQRLAGANLAAAEAIEKRHSTPQQVMASDVLFPGRSITSVPKDTAPSWLKDGFAGLVCDQKRLYLRAVNSVPTPKGSSMLVSSVPLDRNLLGKIVSKLGSLTISPQQVQETASCMYGISAPADGKVLSVTSAEGQGKDRPDSILSVGTLPEPQASFDRELPYGGILESTNWDDGAKRFEFLSGSTRPSALYTLLSASTGDYTGVIGVILVAAAIAFAIVVLIALIIGIRLMRTITYSVANLYKATEHINRGDFTHRIKVRQKDQLAALPTASH